MKDGLPLTLPPMRSILSSVLAVLAIFSVSCRVASGARSRHAHPMKRNIRVINESGVTLDVFWIHPGTRELAHSNTNGDGCAYGSDVNIDTFVGHEFQIIEIPAKGSKGCARPACQRTAITVSTAEDQWFTIDEKFEVSYEDKSMRAREESSKALAECKADPGMSPLDQINQLATCLSEKAELALEKKKEEIRFQSEIRKSIGEKLIDYACSTGKLAMNTTRSIETKQISLGRKKEGKTASVLFESKNSEVVLIDDFTDINQCSGVDMFTEKEGERMVLHPESAKKDKTVSQFLSSSIELASVYGLPMKGITSKPLVQVQKTSPRNSLVLSSEEGIDVEVVSDELVARLLVFCQVPPSGGAIHFPKSGVHVQTSDALHKALLIIYRDPKTLETDEERFLDEYFLCPPEGEMTIMVEDFV